MPRPRSPNRDKAKELWLKSGKTRPLKDIAAELGEPENRIRKWKSEDKWDAETLPKAKGAKRSVPKRSAPNQKPPKKPPKKSVGAPEGNQNAVGNSGGGPVGNKNSEKHGIYRKTLFSNLDDDEWQMINNMPDDEEQHLIDEINLCTVSEKRLLDKIGELKNTRGNLMIGKVVRSEQKRDFASDEDRTLYEERIRQKIENDERLPGNQYGIETTTENVVPTLLKAYAELTRVQSQKTRCIEALNRIRQSREDSKKNSHADDWITALADGEDEDE